MTCPTDDEIRDLAWKAWQRGVHPTYLACKERGLKDCPMTRFYEVITPEWRVQNGLPYRGSRWVNRSTVDHIVTASDIKAATGTSAGKGPKVKESKLKPPAGSTAALKQEHMARERHIGCIS